MGLCRGEGKAKRRHYCARRGLPAPCLVTSEHLLWLDGPVPVVPACRGCCYPSRKVRGDSRTGWRRRKRLRIGHFVPGVPRSLVEAEWRVLVAHERDVGDDAVAFLVPTGLKEWQPGRMLGASQ